LEGWHHHVTLVMLANASVTLEKLRSENFWLDPTADTA
jgi:SRSO17 transposase